MRPYARRSLWYRLRAYAARMYYGWLGLGHCALASTKESDEAVSTETFLGTPCRTLAREAVERYEARVRPLFADMVHWGGGIIGSYDGLESCVLMEMIRRIRPKRIVEVAPNRGYSTALMQIALEGRDDFEHRSYDIEDMKEDVEYTVGRHAALRKWSFFHGDIRALYGEGDHREYIESAELVFIDADHRRDFGEWYVNEVKLFDRAAAGALIHIHDMYPEGTAGRKENPEAEPVFAWVADKRSSVEVLFNYELGLDPELRAKVPRWVFHNHFGGQSWSPSLWLHKPS